ncbi:hypothetical protein JW890_02955 [candidate division WOR-3 bacterium]|nr:hypothetical protein [candidate division WOR-3 bacterium]
MKKNYLIVYAYRDFPLRVAIKDHLYSFEKFSGARCFYLNILERNFPNWLKKINFDLIIFHTVFLSSRWNRELFNKLEEKLTSVKSFDSLKVVLPQDEFINTDQVCDFIRRFKIDAVFSVSPSSEWSKIYKSLTKSNIKFVEVLTGYISEDRIQMISKKIKNIRRDTDIGYRAWKASFWLGRHGQLKPQIAEVFKRKSLDNNLKIDISTRDEDTIKGEEWFDFLLRCKYTIGVEGGSSILDEDGSIKRKTEKYLIKNPDAGFEEVEKACFPAIDGNLRLFALSPRHLEACITKTCQILVEGRYNNVLSPWKHYIPVDKDMKNVDKIIEIVKKDELREEISENAFRDIVLSGKYTYKRFVEIIAENSISCRKIKKNTYIKDNLFFFVNRISEKYTWVKIYFYLKIKSNLLKFIPEEIVILLKRIIGKKCAA